MRKYLIAGLLVWLPLGVTVLVIKLLVDLMDRTLLLLPYALRPDQLFGVHVPGLGVLVALLFVVGTGVVVANLLGRRLVALWESMLARIPLVRSIYSAVKQVLETLLSPGGKSFRKVLLVEFPRRDMWCLAFQTSDDLGEVQAKTGGAEMISVFVPTTPNPTSGFLVVLPRGDVIELDMSVDDGLKMIVSLGVVAPGRAEREAAAKVAARRAPT